MSFPLKLSYLYSENPKMFREIKKKVISRLNKWNVLWRSTEELHQQRMEQMEELYDSHIQTIKRGIEQKLRNQGELGKKY